MNKAILIGNLVADPENRSVGSGISKCTFRIAVNRRFANQQGVRETDFFSIVCWRQLADLCSRFLSKGRKVCVEGSIQNRSYDAQDGTKRYVTEIIADTVEFLGGRGDDESRAAAAPAAPAASGAGAFTEIDDDELPF